MPSGSTAKGGGVSFAADGLAATGIPGLDDVLHGGLPRHRIYLLEGDAGSGKTTLALQFLLEGVRRGEPTLYVTLAETKEELTAVAQSHGWSLEAINVCELYAADQQVRAETQYTLFHPAEVELGETIQVLQERVEHGEPSRVVFDSLGEMRLLARDPLRFRKQVLALKQYFMGRRCTVALLDDRSAEAGEAQVHSIVNGVISLEHRAPLCGVARRRLCVTKLRAVDYRTGYHDFIIKTGGITVFPRLVASEHQRQTTDGVSSSGVAELDALLGGGLHRGTSLLLMGPAGTGKSAIATRFALAAADRDEGVAVYAFDENATTFLVRSHGLGMDLTAHLETGRVRLHQVDPTQTTPDQFSAAVRQSVERGGARLVILDSLNGYLSAMPDNRLLTFHLRELLTYLGHQGVVTVLVSGPQGAMGTAFDASVDVSHIADTVVLLKFFEVSGEVRQSIVVLKKRTGRHDRTIRAFSLGPHGVTVGEALRQVDGVPGAAGSSGEHLRVDDGHARP